MSRARRRPAADVVVGVARRAPNRRDHHSLCVGWIAASIVTRFALLPLLSSRDEIARTTHRIAEIGTDALLLPTPTLDARTPRTDVHGPSASIDGDHCCGGRHAEILRSRAADHSVGFTDGSRAGEARAGRLSAAVRDTCPAGCPSAGFVDTACPSPPAPEPPTTRTRQTAPQHAEGRRA